MRNKHRERKTAQKTDEQAIKLTLQWVFNVSSELCTFMLRAHDDDGAGDEPIIYYNTLCDCRMCSNACNPLTNTIAHEARIIAVRFDNAKKMCI